MGVLAWYKCNIITSYKVKFNLLFAYTIFCSVQAAFHAERPLLDWLLLIVLCLCIQQISKLGTFFMLIN